jgi:hypothetical protein
MAGHVLKKREVTLQDRKPEWDWGPSRTMLIPSEAMPHALRTSYLGPLLKGPITSHFHTRDQASNTQTHSRERGRGGEKKERKEGGKYFLTLVMIPNLDKNRSRSNNTKPNKSKPNSATSKR